MNLDMENSADIGFPVMNILSVNDKDKPWYPSDCSLELEDGLAPNSKISLQMLP